jgi:hypothetical protein
VLPTPKKGDKYIILFSKEERKATNEFVSLLVIVSAHPLTRQATLHEIASSAALPPVNVCSRPH